MKQKLHLLDLSSDKRSIQEDSKSNKNEPNNFIQYELKPNDYAIHKIHSRDKKHIREASDLKDYKPVINIEEKVDPLPCKQQSVIHPTSNDVAARKIDELEKKNEDKKKEIERKINSPMFKIKQKISKILDNNIFVGSFMSMTIFILFIGDIQNGWLSPSVDETIDIIQTVMLILFTFEIILTCIAKDNYVNTFFFWLDIVSTISIIQDIGFMFNPILMGGSTNAPTSDSLPVTFVNSTSSGGGNKNVKNVSSAISKLTAVSRVTRVLRIIRIIRLIRIVKLYKNALIARENMLNNKKQKERLKNQKKMNAESTNQELNNSGRRSSKIFLPQSPKENELNKLIPTNDPLTSNNNLNNDIIQPKMDNENKSELNLKKKIDPIKRAKRNSVLLNEKKMNAILEDKKEIDEKNELIKKEMNKSGDNSNNVDIENLLNESKTSKMITEGITKKVIVLILSLLIVLPILDDSFYANDDIMCYSILANYISNYLVIFTRDFIPSQLPIKLNNTLFKLIETERDEVYPILNITSFSNSFYVNQSFENYTFRDTELSTSSSPDGSVVVIYSMLNDVKLNSILNIIKTICVCICVTTSTVYFEGDVKNLVLDPLEVMIEIVDNVSKDPIKAKNTDDLDTGMKASISKIGEGDKNNKKKNYKKDDHEVKIIQSSIMKIAALLAIGIGEAGSEIIKENLSNHNDLNPMMKGKKKNAIFGFCDIRNFPIVNEALQEDTMVFLNTIADVVHSSVDLFNGATNKNIGDAFLMVWKLPNTEKSNNQLNFKMNNKEKEKPSENNLFPIVSAEVNRAADMAVLGYLKVIIKLNRDLRILAYRTNEEIAKRFHNYKVNMGFGLHTGWAIEGAIGSLYKIDASYLSPNVNMAARLEAATRQYGVNILISGPLFELLSDDLKRICRLIDIVTVKGSIEPIKFYTVDMNENLIPSKKIKKDFSDKDIRFKQNMKKDDMKKKSEIVGISFITLEKKYFKKLLKNARSKIFKKTFKEGFENYISGKWKIAAEKFEECKKLHENDGPTNTLYNYINEFEFTAPETWAGFRALTSK